MPLADHLSRPCLACGDDELEPLLLLTREGALPGTPEHDFAYAHDLIVTCRACDALRLETWRHDCFDFESDFDRHWRFPVAAADGPGLREAVERCASPLRADCECPTHAALRDSLDDLPPRDFTLEADVGDQPPVRVRAGRTGPRFRWTGDEVQTPDEEAP